jgi:NADH dehydrogenase (ubiquinone) Fe-S protein 5
MRASIGGLLRVFASQEGGSFLVDIPKMVNHQLTPSSGSQAERARALQTAYRKKVATYSRDEAPKAGEIRNLGLLDKEEDTKKVLGST